MILFSFQLWINLWWEGYHLYFLFYSWFSINSDTVLDFGWLCNKILPNERISRNINLLYIRYLLKIHISLNNCLPFLLSNKLWFLSCDRSKKLIHPSATFQPHENSTIQDDSQHWFYLSWFTDFTHTSQSESYLTIKVRESYLTIKDREPSKTSNDKACHLDHYKNMPLLPALHKKQDKWIQYRIYAWLSHFCCTLFCSQALSVCFYLMKNHLFFYMSAHWNPGGEIPSEKKHSLGIMRPAERIWAFFFLPLATILTFNGILKYARNQKLQDFDLVWALTIFF